MIKKAANILLIIVLIVAALAIKDRFFPSTVVKTKTVTVTDTVYQDTTIYRQLPKPDPDTVVLTRTDTITKPVDDSLIWERYVELYKAYNNVNIYNDTLKNDTSALIAVNDTVKRNRLQNRELVYENRTPTVINKSTTNIVRKENKFFVGGDFDMNTATPALIYQSKNDISYKIGYDLAGPNQGIRFGVYTSISNLTSIW